ncbi:hypothetical protein KC341_g63 [Hortaea werneckii]|nr:hypothetical protein KC341_g63 [Hortaea werneckii]
MTDQNDLLIFLSECGRRVGLLILRSSEWQGAGEFCFLRVSMVEDSNAWIGAEGCGQKALGPRARCSESRDEPLKLLQSHIRLEWNHRFWRHGACWKERRDVRCQFISQPSRTWWLKCRTKDLYRSRKWMKHALRVQVHTYQQQQQQRLRGRWIPGTSSAESHRRLGDQHPIPRQEQRRTPKSSNANLPASRLPLPPSDHDTPTNSIRLHPPPPSVDNNPTYRQHAWCLRPRCRGRQVHQRLRRLLEASGQAANPRSVST